MVSEADDDLADDRDGRDPGDPDLEVGVSEFNLLDFRKRYPIKPYDRVCYQGGEWEAISFPWPNMLTAVWRPEDGAGINIRRKDDPTSMIEVDASEVSLICEHERSKGCEICGT